MIRSRGEEGCMHAMFGMGALVFALVILLILILMAAVPVPSAAQLGGLEPAWAVGLLLVAIVFGAAVGTLLAGWPVRLPSIHRRRANVEPEDLTDEGLRRTFQRIVEYRQGVADAAQFVGDQDLRRMLNEVVTASEELLPALFRLARRVADGRQSRLLRDDFTRLRERAELLSETEREQLSSLERLDELSRLSGKLIDDTQAILGNCYAQSRGLTLARGLADGEAQMLIRQLREQAALLGHVTEALREVGGR